MSFIGFTKSAAGSDALQIDGHELPISVVAAGGTIAAILLVLHARSKASNVIAVGPSPSAAAATPGADGTAGFSSNAGVIANLSDEITALANGLGNLQSQVAATSIAPPPVIPVTPPPPFLPPLVPDPRVATVQSDYLSILNRAADPSGLDWALGVLASGGNAALTSQLAHSTEAAQLQVNIDYQQLLNRSADPSGLANYTNLYQLQGNDAVRANIMQSAEFGLQVHPAPQAPTPNGA